MRGERVRNLIMDAYENISLFSSYGLKGPVYLKDNHNVEEEILLNVIAKCYGQHWLEDCQVFWNHNIIIVLMCYWRLVIA